MARERHQYRTLRVAGAVEEAICFGAHAGLPSVTFTLLMLAQLQSFSH
jgi:hypothetical protein